MTERSVTLDELIAVREALIAQIASGMPEDHRRFLISIKHGRPEWALLDVPGVEMLPAVRWMLDNLAKLDSKRRAALLGRLNEVLGVHD